MISYWCFPRTHSTAIVLDFFDSNEYRILKQVRKEELRLELNFVSEKGTFTSLDKTFDSEDFAVTGKSQY